MPSKRTAMPLLIELIYWRGGPGGRRADCCSWLPPIELYLYSVKFGESAECAYSNVLEQLLASANSGTRGFVYIL